MSTERQNLMHIPRVWQIEVCIHANNSIVFIFNCVSRHSPSDFFTAYLAVLRIFLIGILVSYRMSVQLLGKQKSGK